MWDLLREVNPIGGEEKSKACQIIAENLNNSLAEGFYCGDSITDVQALKLVREGGGGVSLSFNGNRYALKAAEFYALSGKANLFLELARRFLEGGRLHLRKFSKKLEEDYEFGPVPEEERDFLQLLERSEAFRKK